MVRHEESALSLLRGISHDLMEDAEFWQCGLCGHFVIDEEDFTEHTRKQHFGFTAAYGRSIGRQRGGAMWEAETVKVKAEHPGILDLKSGEFMKKGASYFIDLAKDKGHAAIMRALVNLERWNKKKHPSIAKHARAIINKMKKED